MTNSSNTTLFRKQALERAASPERLDQLVQVIAPKNWLLLAALSSLVISGVIWSFVGRIPITVTGKGVLIYPGGVIDFQSPSSGRILNISVKVGDLVKKGDLLATIDQAELQKQLQQQQAKLTELIAQNQTANTLQNRRSNSEQSATSQQIRSLEIQLQTNQALMPRLKDRWQRRLALKAQGGISEDTVLEAERMYQESADKVATLKAQIEDLTVKEQGVAEKDFEASTTRSKQILEVKQVIGQLETQLKSNGQITSQHDGRILEITAMPGQVLTQGVRIGTIAAETENSTAELKGITFFADGDGKKIQPGMKVEITPATVQRERFGSIIAVVNDVSPFPVTQEGVARIVGHAAIAQNLTEKGAQIQVSAQLQQDPSTFSGLRWSSSKGPQLKVSSGTTATVQVTIEERTPISFVLPIFRSWTGTN
jgi:HlyD family secretion protein